MQFVLSEDTKSDLALQNFKRGLSNERKKLWIKAIRFYRRAIRAGFEEPEVWRRLGQCLFEIEQYAMAIPAFRKALLGPNCSADCYARLGDALRATGQLSEAASIYRLAWNKPLEGGLPIRLGATPSWKPLLAELAVARFGEIGRIDLLNLDEALQGSNCDDNVISDILVQARAKYRYDHIWWLFLSSHLLQRGYARSFLVSKRYAAADLLEAWASNVGRSRSLSKMAASSAAYIGDFEFAYRILNHMLENATAETDDVNLLRADILTQDGRGDEARSSLPIPVGGYDPIKDARSVAVVGPASADGCYGSIIDQHEMVVRTNFLWPDAIERQRHLIGSRTNVVYYSSSRYLLRDKEAIAALKANPVRQVVTRHRVIADRIRAAVPGQDARPWKSRKSDFVGIGFAMRHILTDLLLVTDRKPVVFGVDFYLGTNTHYRGYKDDRATDVPHEYARHDVFDSFIAMQRLRNTGQISCAPELDDILRLDILKFADLVRHRCFRSDNNVEPSLLTSRPD